MHDDFIKVSAPGSVMLLGEHAVLQGFPALVCAVNYRISVQIKWRSDKKVNIVSALGRLEVTLENLALQQPFEFVIAAVLFYRDKLKAGFDLLIESEFSHQVGLGSSSAVTVASVMALRKAVGLPDDLDDVFITSREIVRQVQGCGSGADVAASVFGGIVSYCAEPLKLKKYEASFPLALFFSGSKTPTPEVIRYVDERFENDKEKQRVIYKAIGALVEKASKPLVDNDSVMLGKLFNEQQLLMDELGVNTKALQQIIDRLRKNKNWQGIKISGSGLGDCVVALGEFDAKNLKNDERYIPISVEGIGAATNK